MNFLAHLYLSCQSEELMIGNFIADFIKNREVSNYSAKIQEGIQLHRSIDHYTDNHPLVLQGARRLHPAHGKYAAVVIDVYYDYLLANNWSKFSEESLDDFTAKTYKVLEKHLAVLPEKLRKVLPYWIEDNWLVKYGQESGLAFTFERMKNRVSKPEMLDQAPQSLMADLPSFEQEFVAFFPDVQQFVMEQCDC